MSTLQLQEQPLNELIRVIEQLSLPDLDQLITLLIALRTHRKAINGLEGEQAELTSDPPTAIRVVGLHPGAISMSDDFDEPLPDEFWLGEA